MRDCAYTDFFLIFVIETVILIVYMRDRRVMQKSPCLHQSQDACLTH